jgi:hypothetical protein
MSAVITTLAEGLELLDNLISAAASVSSAVKTAQETGTPLDLSTVLNDEATAENAVLAAIASAQLAGR